MEYELSEIKLENELTLDLELDILKIEPKLEEKNIVENGEYIPQDEGLDGYSKVNVNVPIPKLEENQRIEIVENGNYNVTPSGDYDAIKKVEVNVNVPEPKLGTKTITSNGTYKAIDDNLDGYSEVEVATSGVDINEYMSDTITKGTGKTGGWTNTILKLRSPLTIEGTNAQYMFYGYPLNEIPQIDTSNVTNMAAMFYECSNLQTMLQINTSKVTDISVMFRGCSKLIEIPLLDTSNVTNMSQMFYECSSLTTIPQSNGGKLTNINYAFSSCKNITDFNGLINLGQAYLTTANANNSNYKLNLSSSTLLTEQSIINILNNLYDIATKGVKPQTVTLGSTNLAKLTSAEGQQALQTAQSRGWNIN